MNTTETKHTPGPWRIQGEGTLNHPVSGRPLTTQRFETSLGCFEVLDETNEPEANARLIASAPAMLDALKRVTEFLSEAHAEDKAAAHYGDDPDTCTYCQAINQANAAIAQAQGGGE